ncbi:MAG: hypothetical protein WCO47_11685, partial [Methylococcus sp.]
NKKPLCTTQRGFFIQGLKLTTLISGVPFDGFWAFDALSWSASLDERPDDSIRGGGSTDGDAPWCCAFSCAEFLSAHAVGLRDFDDADATMRSRIAERGVRFDHGVGVLSSPAHLVRRLSL